MPDAGRGFRKELAAAASLFHGLADPTRLAIVRRLSVGEARIVDLTELAELLAAAEALLAVTGDAVVLCPNYGSATTARTGTTGAAEDER